MSEGDVEELKTYRGNCHCAAYVFEVRLQEVKEGHQCNCSVCYKRGGVLFPSHGDATFVRGSAETLSTYTFGNQRFRHQFCSTCGSYLFCMGSLSQLQDENKLPQLWVNLRVIQNFNIWGLDIQMTDGASVPPAYTPLEFKGQEPPADIEGARIYTGSCHCGAVTLALKSKPIDNTYEGKVIECDCSICNRNGYCWVYPKKSQVSIDGVDNLSYYAFERCIWKKTFCKTCGVPIHNHMEDFTEEQLRSMCKEDREWTSPKRDWSPVNLRVLNGVDLSILKIERLRGSILRDPPYVNP